MTDPVLGSRSRRRLLTAVGAGTAVGLAGCLGGDDDGSDAADDGGQDDGGSDIEYIDHPGDGPIEFESDHRCGVCTMGVTDYSERNAQVAHESGDGMTFCSSGCLVAYLSAPDHFDGPDSEITGVWTTDFDTGDLIDAEEAYFALEHDSQRGDDPMGVDPRVYADEELALEYVDQYDDLSEDDVITYDDIDEDVADIYRESHLP